MKVSQEPSVAKIPARAGLTPTAFDMHVYSTHDIVSDFIKKTGSWDEGKTRMMIQKLGEVQSANSQKEIVFLDIGANVGWFTLTVAAAGYKVVAVEPMIANHMLLRPSICANKGFSDRITLYDVGLNNQKEQCFLFSDIYNKGDGTTACSTDTSKTKDWNPDPEKYVFLQNINVETLDSVMAAHKGQYVGLVKIDVEGFEPWVLKGGMEFFSNKANRPPFIITEFSPGMILRNAKKGDPLDFLRTWDSLGYHIYKNSWTDGRLQPSEFPEFVEHIGNGITDIFVVDSQVE
ncbi:S-adenosyl-L-methionine-dependent methyltransferase [Gaertneriomyces semiglobifer]|nr:S-adenosyl-L-methionine-dependent methyltransferase [Gaertneriomyces semiglobifer]